MPDDFQTPAFDKEKPDGFLTELVRRFERAGGNGVTDCKFVEIVDAAYAKNKGIDLFSKNYQPSQFRLRTDYSKFAKDMYERMGTEEKKTIRHVPAFPRKDNKGMRNR